MSGDRDLRGELEKQQARLRALERSERPAEIEAAKNALEPSLESRRARIAELQGELDFALAVKRRDRFTFKLNPDVSGVGVVSALATMFPAWLMATTLLEGNTVDRVFVWVLSAAAPVLGGWLLGAALKRRTPGQMELSQPPSHR